MRYEPDVVSLIGTMRSHDFPGPPNYESVKTGDRLERYWLLHLAQPICLEQSGADKRTNTSEASVGVIQIVFLNSEAYEKYRSLLRKPVRITGTLFHSITGHHHTPALITASTVELTAPRPSPAR